MKQFFLKPPEGSQLCQHIDCSPEIPILDFWLPKWDQALNLWSGSNDSKTLECQRTNPQFSAVQFSRSVLSDSLRPHESRHQQASLSITNSQVHSDSRPSSPWCHPAISSSVIPFSSCPQSLPASESFPMGQLFAWGGHGKRIWKKNRYTGMYNWLTLLYNWN